MLDIKKIAISASFPVFVLIARFVPFDRLPPTCQFFRFTGLPCPSCGMTRSVMALAHLNFQRAVMFNPLGIVFLALFALWWVNALCEVYTGRRTRFMNWAIHHLTSLAIIGLVVLFTFGGIRIWRLVH